ncbi:probable ATP-dependent DNA helicase RecS [Littorina saxatilis]|uniref:probable ATP-dependent DNA helicase RecS n=1 Tax=Littorina saxatilis TaxID=31220 RepID=UPI0038B59629
MLPTGYGKSLIYELLPTVVNIFQGQDTKTLVFIVAPLNVIIKQELQKLGASCTELKRGNTNQLKSSICDVNFIIGHPEAFVSNKELGEILSAWPVNIRTFIVIDEAHCVLEWEAEFRPAYQELSCLRILLPKAPVLASQQQLADSLCLRHYQSVLEPPVHACTFLSEKKRPVSTDTLEVVEPLLVDILTKKQNCPETVVAKIYAELFRSIQITSSSIKAVICRL